MTYTPNQLVDIEIFSQSLGHNINMRKQVVKYHSQWLIVVENHGKDFCFHMSEIESISPSVMES